MLFLLSSDTVDHTDDVVLQPRQNRRIVSEQARHMQRQGIGVYKIVLLLIYGCCFWFLFRYLFWDHIQRLIFPEQDNQNYTDLLERIDLNCDGILKNDQEAIQKAKLMRYNTHSVEKLIMDADDRCLAIRRYFGFDKRPNTQEERDYPLAYGVIVYKNLVQVLFMLSSFYRPQNEYCIAVSGGADPMFKHIMSEVDQCFSNIRVLNRPRIDWGSYEIINSTFACLKVLSNSETPWKYFQYLAGVDIPLKTNLEMVEILKQFNNTVNAEITRFQTKRIRSKRIEAAPLPLYKASLSATVPRAAIDKIVKSSETRALLFFLLNTSIPDESFWGTLTGNIDKFPIPGGVDAAKWLQYREQYLKNHTEQLNSFERQKYHMRYYLSRYQLWDSHCRGKMASGSCIFGINDLSDLLKQPHLVAHKLYIDFEPAAFFCGLKEIRARETRPLQLDLQPYKEIPQVELSMGVSFENLSHPLWLF